MLSIILLLCVLVMARAERVEFGHEGNAGHRSTRKYDKICKSIHKQRINKRKTTESQRIEEEANWKNVQRVYGICVGNPLEMIFPNALCTLLAWPSRNSVKKLRMLSRRYLDEMGHASPSSWKGIISPMLQEAESPPPLVSDVLLMFPPSCTLMSTLRLTENIGEITHVTSFSLYFLGTPIFFTCPTPLPPPSTHKSHQGHVSWKPRSRSRSWEADKQPDSQSGWKLSQNLTLESKFLLRLLTQEQTLFFLK